MFPVFCYYLLFAFCSLVWFINSTVIIQKFSGNTFPVTYIVVQGIVVWLNELMFLTVLLYLDITALFIICICINVQFIRHDKTYLCCNYSQANQQCVADDMYASIVLSVK